jgi:hypothetical protein
LQITEERKRRLIDLYFNQHKTYAEIAQIEKISPRDIHAIIKEEQARRQRHKDQQQQEDLSAQAYELFSQEKTPLQVAISLKIRQSVATKIYREYWKLKRLHKLNLIYKETNGKLGPFLKLYQQLVKKKGMSVEQVANAADTDINKLPHMENLYLQAKDEEEKMQRTIQGLVNDIEERENKISFLDRISFTCEQDSKRTEQRVQALTNKKDRIEKLIANILNGEGYSKLMQIFKESVKGALSENRKLMYTFFVEYSL